jgi:hypothetical protein
MFVKLGVYQGRLKIGDCSRDHHIGRENHNCSLLLIQSLNLGYIFHSSVFPQAHTNVNFIETHFHFIQFKYKAVVYKQLET